MKPGTALLVAFLLTAARAPTETRAQTATAEPSLEFGLDASYLVSFPDDGNRLTAIEIPFGRVRFGAYLGSRVLLEVGAGFALAETSDRSASTGRGDAAFSYHFGSDARRTRFFVLLGGGGRWATTDGSTAGQAFATGGLGLKIPIHRV
ncbi:MAG: hypothetical protein ACC682_16215, partial [Gemmatimonadota bacterium]